MIDSLQSTEGIVVWSPQSLILVLNDLKPRVFYQLTARMGSGTKGRSFGLSLLLKKISCVVPILRKLETGSGSKKSRYFIEQDHRA